LSAGTEVAPVRRVFPSALACYFDCWTAAPRCSTPPWTAPAQPSFLRDSLCARSSLCSPFPLVVWTNHADLSHSPCRHWPPPARHPDVDQAPLKARGTSAFSCMHTCLSARSGFRSLGMACKHACNKSVDVFFPASLECVLSSSVVWLLSTPHSLTRPPPTALHMACDDLPQWCASLISAPVLVFRGAHACKRSPGPHREVPATLSNLSSRVLTTLTQKRTTIDVHTTATTDPVWTLTLCRLCRFSHHDVSRGFVGCAHRYLGDCLWTDDTATVRE
jgi:hypothetical protein